MSVDPVQSPTDDSLAADLAIRDVIASIPTPFTDDPSVDSAVARLTDLQGRPVEDHEEVLQTVLSALETRLGEAEEI